MLQNIGWITREFLRVATQVLFDPLKDKNFNWVLQVVNLIWVFHGRKLNWVEVNVRTIDSNWPLEEFNWDLWHLKGQIKIKWQLGGILLQLGPKYIELTQLCGRDEIFFKRKVIYRLLGFFSLRHFLHFIFYLLGVPFVLWSPNNLSSPGRYLLRTTLPLFVGQFM